MTHELDRQSTSADVQAENTPGNLHVEKVRKYVEEALALFGKTQPGLNQNKTSGDEEDFKKISKKFIGKLSTDPNKVNEKIINQKSLSKPKTTDAIFSKELHRCLELVGLTSTLINLPEHSFLAIDANSLLEKGLKDESIIIDATFGKHAEGHNNVFIGTFKTLKETVFEYSRAGKLSVISGSVKKSIPLFKTNQFIKSHWR